MIGIKKAAVALAAGGTALGLISMGVGASFSDAGSATQTIKVGTFGIMVGSTNSAALVVNSGVAGAAVHTVTLNSPDILSSLPGTAPLPFTVTSTGTIPALIHVVTDVSSTLYGPFTSMLGTPADVVLGQNAVQAYTGGISWTALGDADLGKSVRVVYTITAGENVAPTLPALGTLTRVGNVLTVRVNHVVPQPNGADYTILPGDKLFAYCSNNNLTDPAIVATADAAGIVYWNGTITAAVATSCPAGQGNSYSGLWVGVDAAVGGARYKFMPGL